MVLCIAKPTAGCACAFTALTVAVATGLVCLMAFFQASLAAHGHIWTLDWAVASTPFPPTGSTARAFALASEWEAVHWEIRNSTHELRTFMSARLDAMRTEFVQSREQEQRELLDALTRQRTEILDTIGRLHRSTRRDANQLRGELFNITMEHSKEISDLQMEQLKRLESIKHRLRGAGLDKKGKKSAIEEGLWGLISSVKEEKKREHEADQTVVDIESTTSPETSTTLLPPQTKPREKKDKKEKKKSAIAEGLFSLLMQDSKGSANSVKEGSPEDSFKTKNSAASEKKKSAFTEALRGFLSSAPEEPEQSQSKDEVVTTSTMAVSTPSSSNDTVATPSSSNSTAADVSR